MADFRVTEKQLAAIRELETKAVKALTKRLADAPFGEPGDTELTKPVPKGTVDAIVRAVRKAGATDAAELIRVLASIAGAGTSAFFTGRIPIPGEGE